MIWYNLFRINKKKKLTSVDFDQPIEPVPICLKVSPLYSHRLVNIHTIVHTYVSLIADKPSHDWTRIQTFTEVWCFELERIYKHVQSAAVTLKSQIEDLTDLLCEIASPLKNKGNDSIYEVQQFISNCLKDICEYLSNKEGSTKSMHSHFRNYHRDLEDRIQSISNEKNTPLTACMEQVYRLEQELSLYQYYIESQMQLLQNLGSIVHYQSPRLTTHWNSRYQRSQQVYQALLDQFSLLLENQLACPQDMTCVICLSALHEPVTLRGCHHTFCKECLQQHYCYSCSFQKKKRGFIASLIKNPLIECSCFALDLEGQLVSAQHPPCPLCRRAFTPQDCELDIELEKLIMAYDKQKETKKKNRRSSFKSCAQYINSSLARITC